MIDWLIVGGGICGTHLAVRLRVEAGLPGEAIAIVDPAGGLLDRWRACTAAVGMEYLRSPAVHNLDAGPYALLRFAKRGGWDPIEALTSPADGASLWARRVVLAMGAGDRFECPD